MKTIRPFVLMLALAAAGAHAQPVLNIYSARHYQTDEALYSNFTKQTGIKINRIEGKEDELLERIKNEGANSPADVFVTVDASRLENSAEHSWHLALMILVMREYGATNEAEFFADYRRDHEQSRYKHLIYERVAEAVRCYSLSVDFTYGKTEVSVQAPTRGDIEAVFEVFNDGQERSQLPRTEEDASPVRPTIFIGHGRNPQWRDLKDHLSEKHGYHVQAYETGARAGHTIRDILDELARTSSFALLVLTGEDLLADGGTRARQNVVHELGLFQGKLGFTRAIALLEDGTEEFSNIHGINQIRFSKGNIREVFGEVVATLRREFGAM